mmetsp:Transcript_18852/g.26581  ORF Transcript_18852/g.26581 Transcript_18852/m.26581 type:complete len:468 (-) Transcript_18852:191-1594(-)
MTDGSSKKPPPSPANTADHVEKFLKDLIERSVFLVEDPFAENDVAPIEMDEIILGNKLGNGAFSDAYEVSGFRLKSDDIGPLTPHEEKTRQALLDDTVGVAENDDDDSTVASVTSNSSRGSRSSKSTNKSKKKTPKVYKKFVIKHLKPDLFEKGQYGYLKMAACDIVKEACFLASIQHPHILRLRGMAKSGPQGFANGRPDGFFLLLDRLSGDKLFDRLYKWKDEISNRTMLPMFSSMPERLFLEKVLKVAADVASALSYLHKHNIMHRDIKPTNLGFNMNGDVILFDFGFAVEVPPSKKSNDGEDELENETFQLSGGVGSFRYMATEVALMKPYNVSADVYSFFAVFYEMLALRKFCYEYDGTCKDDFSAAVHVKGSRPSECETISNSNQYCWPIELQKLMHRGWSNDPSVRPSMSEVNKSLHQLHSETKESLKERKSRVGPIRRTLGNIRHNRARANTVRRSAYM